MYGLNKHGLWNLAPQMITGIVSSPITPRQTEPAVDSSKTEPSFPDPSRLSVHSETASILIGTDTDDDDSSWDSDGDGDSFVETESSDDEEQEMTEEQRKEEREARALERQRVLEAAGLIITKSERKPPPRPARRKSSHRRRPAPAVPVRPRHKKHSSAASRDLPSLPESESRDTSLRLDDAYERYEAYKQSNAKLNRLSIVSVDSAVSAPSPSPSFTLPRSPSVASTEHEGRSHSHFLHFFGRKTPANDGETRVMPVISAPILQDREPGTPSASDSGFGTVSLLKDTGAYLSEFCFPVLG